MTLDEALACKADFDAHMADTEWAIVLKTEDGKRYWLTASHPHLASFLWFDRTIYDVQTAQYFRKEFAS